MSEPKKDCECKGKVTEDWREITEKMTIPEKYQYMLDHDILTDCTFVVGPEDGETKQFKAHRLHLATASPVFEKMLLRGEMVEVKTGHVRVTDLSPDTFQLLLSSIYGKEPEIKNFQEAQDLTFAAHKYKMKALPKTCFMRMNISITPGCIWALLEAAGLLHNEHLKKCCVKVLQHDTLRLITDPGFMRASEENVALLLEQDELNMEDELLLVNIIVHWARHEARRRGLADDDEGVRAVLEPRLLRLLRFLALTYQQFVFGPGLASWLTSEEKAAISDSLRSKDYTDFPQHLSSVAQKRRNVLFTSASAALNKESSGKFVCNREIILTRPNVGQSKKNCCQLGNPGSKVFYHCLHAKLIFKVSSSCKWLGFQCASRCRANTSADPTSFSSQSPVYEEKFFATTFRFNHTLSTDFKLSKISETINEHRTHQYNSNITIMFKKPMTLFPDNWFALEVVYQHNNSDVPAGEYPNPSRARKVYTAAGVEFTFRTEEQEGYHTSVNDGLIESLIFSL